MGIGRTTEEEADIIDVNPDGSVASITTGTLRAARPIPPAYAVPPQPATAAPQATVKESLTTGASAQTVDQASGEITDAAAAPPQDWQPSAGELASIREREMAEASGAQQEPPRRSRRAAQPGLDIE
jgi:hypothetical protein